MIADLEILTPYIFSGFIAFFRVAAFVALLPGFGEASVPARIKLSLAIVFTILVLPLLPKLDIQMVGVIDLTRMILTEALVGATLGLGLRIIVLAIQTAGTIAAQSTSLSQVFGTAGVEPMPAMGHILVVGAIALSMISGLHVKAAMLFVASYDLFPIGVGIGGQDMGQWGSAQVAYAFRLAFSLAMPFLILSMLYNLTLGVVNKAMPQLMVAFVGAPAITLGGMFLLFTTAPLMLEVWYNSVEAYLNDPLGVR